MGNIKDEAAQWLDGTAANITFIVTKDCQLACKYCYLVGKNDKERMSFLTAKKAIDYILTSSLFFGRQKSVILDFIGGEPLLEVELIDKICDYFKLQTYIRGHKWFDAYRINLTTNGLNYHTKKVRKFIEKNITHLSITITIDGNEIKHDLNRVYKNSGKGSYKNVLKNIPLWLQDFKDIGTKVTISSADIPYIKESVLHLFSLGIHHLYTNCVFEDVWKEGDDKLFEDQLMQLADIIIDNEYYKDFTCSFFSENIGKPLDPILENQNWCGAGKMLAVDAAEMFYPCTRFAGYSLREKKPIIIGNVRDGIDKNKLRPFLTLDRTTQSPQKCLDCEVASGCAWCQGENYDAAETNTIYQRATAICLMHKARVRANNYYWNKLYRKLELEGQREEFEKNKRKVKPVDC
ncbi:MAG: radical SAM peptide maturase, CXXX-repeat target family [Muribaculaceae bacterium]|nr:radical SAM peptide maturase, CXXX-repeat target family [Muribaculaceae bacterium]